jgi:hypothetical protein
LSEGWRPVSRQTPSDSRRRTPPDAITSPNPLFFRNG